MRDEVARLRSAARLADCWQEGRRRLGAESEGRVFKVNLNAEGRRVARTLTRRRLFGSAARHRRDCRLTETAIIRAVNDAVFKAAGAGPASPPDGRPR